MEVLAILGMTAGATLMVVSLYLVYFFAKRQTRRIPRPDWDRFCADTEYFRYYLYHIFSKQGYKVTGHTIVKDPTDRESMTVMFSLRRNGRLYCGFCARWWVPVTSEVIDNFEKALASTRAQQGLIVTTSHYSPAALQRAKGLPVILADQDDLKKWIDKIWW